MQEVKLKKTDEIDRINQFQKWITDLGYSHDSLLYSELKILKRNSEIYNLNFDDMKISDILGFETRIGKGYFVYSGLRIDEKVVVHAISISPAVDAPNTSFGKFNNNQYTSIPKYLNGCELSIEKMYKFDSQEDLHKWLSE